jgi:FMN phosphatase YigB (HAD superfamily)/biotin carboxylase
MNILFTGIGRRVELLQVFREAASDLGVELKIYGADADRTAPALSFCDLAWEVCGMKEDGYIPQLMEICKEERIDLLIPTIDTDLLILSRNRERFELYGTKVLISRPEMIAVCRDKNRTAVFFEDCGLKTPKTINRCELYEAPWPCFIKPKDGSSSRCAFRVENKRQLKLYADSIKDYVIQPYIEGTEYTVDIFCDLYGNPVYIIPRVRISVRAGEVLKTQITLDRQIIEECRRLIESFKPRGPLTVQIIRNQRGEDYFIEINPRFGGGAPLSMRAGANGAKAILQILNGKLVSFTYKDINKGAIYCRFDQSVCMREGKKHGIRGVIFDLDDTLYSEKDYIKSGYKAVAYYLKGNDYADRLWDFFQEGKPAIDSLLEEIGRENEKENCLIRYRNHKPVIRLYNGIAELLKKLKAHGIKVGLVTDGRPEGQRNKIVSLGLENLVDDIIITDELGGIQFRKPCDISLRIVQRRWKLPFEQLMYIGDNAAKDFHAPKQLGMQYTWFNNKDGLYYADEPETDNICSSLEQMIIRITESTDM